jgi:hypothetical protein
VAQSATVLYISGEESERQIKMRAERLSPPSPGPFPLKGEGENTGNLDVMGSTAAHNIQISGIHPPSRPVSGGEKGGRGDMRGNLSTPEPDFGGGVRGRGNLPAGYQHQRHRGEHEQEDDHPQDGQRLAARIEWGN